MNTNKIFHPTLKRYILSLQITLIVPILFLMSLVFTPYVQAATLSGGNSPIIPRPDLDGRTDFTLVDTNNPISANGRIEEVSFFAKTTTKIQLKIFRKVGTNYTMVGQSDLITPSLLDGINTFSLDPAISVNKDDLVGLYFETNAVVPFTLDSGSYAREDLLGKVLFTNSGENPQVGQVAGFDDSSERTYSVSVSGTVEYRVDDDAIDCPTADFTTIQSAIASPLITEGETIYVCKGLYNGPIIVNKKDLKIVSLEGAQKTIVEAGLSSGVEYGFSVRREGIVINGFTIRNADNTTGAVGIIVGTTKVNPSLPAEVKLADGAEIVSNTFDHNNFGLYAWKTNNLKTSNNIFQNGQSIGGSGAALTIWDGTGTPASINNNEIASNIFKDNDTLGILLGASPGTGAIGNKITNNVLDGSGDGTAQLELAGINKTTVASNVFKDSKGTAIKLTSADDNSFEMNQITHPKAAGISLGLGTDINKIISNVIQNAGSGSPADGIFLGNGAKNNLVKSNTVVGSSRDGIRAANGSRKNTMQSNIINGSSGKDARDLNPSSVPTAQKNIWKSNICFTSAPAGLCRLF